MKWQINIGSIYNLDSKKTENLQTIIITDEQFEVIKQFANTNRDKELNVIYTLNQCAFTITPHFEIKK